MVLGKASPVILNMALRQLIPNNQFGFFLAAQCFHKVFLAEKKREEMLRPVINAPTFLNFSWYTCDFYMQQAL